MRSLAVTILLFGFTLTTAVAGDYSPLVIQSSLSVDTVLSRARVAVVQSGYYLTSFSPELGSIYAVRMGVQEYGQNMGQVIWYEHIRIQVVKGFLMVMGWREKPTTVFGFPFGQSNPVNQPPCQGQIEQPPMTVLTRSEIDNIYDTLYNTCRW